MEPRLPARTVCLWKGHTEGPHVKAEETCRRETAKGGTRFLQSPCSTDTVTLWEMLTQTKLLPGQPRQGSEGSQALCGQFPRASPAHSPQALYRSPSQRRTDPGHPLRTRRLRVPPPALQQLTAEARVPAAAAETVSTLPAPSSRRS